MICSSVNLLRFMSVSFAGEQTNLKVRTFQGSRSVTITPSLPRCSISTVRSRATSRPEIEVSTTGAGPTFVTSSIAFRVRTRRRQRTDPGRGRPTDGRSPALQSSVAPVFQ
jgi:hypothetical protein